VRALVTNDDGIDSPGLHLLARLATEAGLDVVVAAPDREYSGSGAALTAEIRRGGRLAVQPRQVEGLAAERVLAVEASPAFIAFAGVRGAFGGVPDLVLSGINRGPNTGTSVLHSGTVGAALTAATHRVPGVAVSLAAVDPQEWGTAEGATRRVLRWLAGHPLGPVALNVNVPDVPPDRLRGLRPARLAAFGAVQADVGETGDDYVTLTWSDVPGEPDPDSDVALLRQGWATATVLRWPGDGPDVGLRGLDEA
jgi:5'-nucleotidase